MLKIQHGWTEFSILQDKSISRLLYMYRNKDWFYFVNYGSGSGFLVARSYVKKEEIIYEPDGFPLHSDE